jgi:mono/diheme cytochrome c family protein
MRAAGPALILPHPSNSIRPMNRFAYLSLSGLTLALTLLAIAVHAQEAPRLAEEAPPATQTTPPAAQQPAPSVDPKVSRLFATSCGWCHQGGGRAAGRGPKLAGTDKSDEFIIRQIKQGKPPGMPAFGKSFNDDQIQAIVAYIRALPETP